MRCPTCGTAGVPGKKFCAECGSPLSNQCANCGSESPPDAKYCGDCGTALFKSSGIELAEPPAAEVTGAKAADDVRLTGQRAASAAIEGERKTVTALFADIKGSTELMEELDPEDARRVVDPALQLMIDAVHRYDGYVVQSTGDGIFALFGAPVAREDHPQRALHAALRIQREMRRLSTKLASEGGTPLEARVGVNTGEVVVRSLATGEGHVEYTAIGHTANLASRMQVVAPTGSIAISEQTRKLVDGYFQVKALGPSRVKGISGPVAVYEVTGLGALRTRLQRSVTHGLSRFVGRSAEIAQMNRALDYAKSGRGQIVAAIAEPGIGKSRLFFEFKAIAQSGCMLLETFAVSHGRTSPYLPVLNLLHGYFRLASEDDQRVRRAKVTGKVLNLDHSLENTLPYLFALLGIVEGEDPLAQMDAQLKKRRTLEAIKRILLRESLNQPLIVIFEDLHWIDEATQEFLNLLADSLGTARILLLVNYRPEYSHQWNSKSYYTQLRLDPLGQESAEKMLSALLGDGIAVAPLKQLIIDKTEGNPFFMEEMVKVLLDEGVLARDGAAVRLTQALNALKVPPTVQGILAARIDRLPSEAKDLLQTLAVIGRDFPLSLIRAVVAKSDDEINRLLNDLQLGEFIYEQPATVDSEFIFKHALTQDIAANSLLIEKRKALHERTAQAIEELYRERLDDHVGDLAHHYAQSTNTSQAVKYLFLAAQQALQRSAHLQAIAHLTAGLELLGTLPESGERDARELELMSALAQVLQLTSGFTAPDTRAAGARARALAEKVGNLAQLVLQEFEDWRSVFLSGDYAGTAVLADRILDLAQREGGRTSLAFAYRAQQTVSFYRGDLVRAEEHFARMSGFHEVTGVRRVRGAIVAAMGLAGLCASVLGKADTARERIERGIAFARNSQRTYDLAFGRFFESWIYQWRAEPQNTLDAATHAFALAEEHGFPILRDMARTTAGWARARIGDTAAGVALIRQGITGLHEIGTRANTTQYLTFLGIAQVLDGRSDDALITIEEALRANPAELVFRPHIMICRGDIRLTMGHAELAEADFRDAIALAQGIGAKAWELRATTSLARVLEQTGRREPARAMLAKIYGWFTEGFDTNDLKEARGLLDRLEG